MREAETFADRLMIRIGCLSLILMTLVLAVRWNRMPDRLPTHYDFDGTITGWGNRTSLIGIALTGWALHITMYIVSRHPRIWNTGAEITQENALRIYRILYHMLSSITLITDLMFVYITLQTIWYTVLPIWILNLFLAALAVDLIASLVILKLNA